MKIKIKNKIIEILDKELLITKNVNTYKIDIEIDDDFKRCTNLYVVYKNENVIKKEIIGPDFKSTIPHEVLDKTGTLYMGFFGTYLDGDVLKERHVTNLDKLTIVEGSYYEEATNTEEIDVTILEKYLAEMNLIYKTYLEELNKISTDISNMKNSVETSEQNAKTSEDNAKASETSAQNSANKASQSETNVVNIEKNINAIKEQIDTIKTNMDGQVNTVNALAENAATQATKAENQAKISTENATATSADKTAVSEMKSEVEGLKNEAKTSRDEAESFKYETLEAKEVVKNSLENERIESEKRYAKAVDTEVITVEEFAQVELDEDGYMEDVSIEASKEITQETHDSTANILYTQEKYWEIGGINQAGALQENKLRLRSKELMPIEELINYYCSIEDSKYRFVNIHYYDSNKIWLVNQESITNNINNNQSQSFTTPEGAKYFKLLFKKADETEMTLSDLAIAKPMVVKGTTKIDFIEGYPVMPSLNYPSEFQNILKEVEVRNSQKQLFDKNDASIRLNAYFESKDISTLNNNINNKIIYIRIAKNQAYTIQKKQSARYRTAFSYDKPQDGIEIYEVIDNIYSMGNSTTITRVNSNYNYLILLYYNALNDTLTEQEILDSIQIELGNEATAYDPYQGNTSKLALPEGQFLGNFKGYSNAIDKGILKGQFKEIILTGKENWIFEEAYNKFGVYNLKLNNANNSKQICTHYKKFAADANNVGEFSSSSGAIRCHNDNNFTLAEWKAYLAEQYANGTPVKILHVAQTEEQQELSQENLQVVNSLQTYQGENNVSVPEAKLSFKANQGIPSYVAKVVDKKLVEKNLSEREISDNKYARALKREVPETDFTQVFAENEKIEGLQIYGEELTQETREGYNELDINSLSTLTKNGVTWTINGDGSISVSGTCVNYESNVTLKAGKLDVGEYTYKCFGLPDTCKTNIWSVGDVIGEGIRRFTAKEGVDHNVVVVVPIGETVNFTIKPILVKGSYTNDTLPPYEQYGAMPSLDSPSEVHTMNDRVNLFDKDNVVTGYINKNGEIIYTSTDCTSDYIKVEPNTNYSRKITNGNAYFDKDKNIISYDYVTAIKTPSNCAYIRITVPIANKEAEKLEKGSKSTPYSSHGQSVIEFVNIERNILNTLGIELTRVGLTVKSNDDGGIHISGKPTSTYTTLREKQKIYLYKSLGLSKNIRVALNYGKDKRLLKDSSFGAFLWLNRGTSIVNAINSTNNQFAHALYGNIDNISFGIEGLKTDKEYNEDIYISAEIYTENKLPTEFSIYQGNNTLVPFPQDTFTGAIGSYKDIIKEVDGRWKVEKWIKEYVLNGTENWAATTTKEKTQVFEWWFGYISEKYFNATSKVLSNYFKYGLDGDVEKVASSSTSIYIAINKETASTLEQFKAKLKELYDAGKPVKVYIVLVTPDYIDLPDETQEILNGIKLRLGLNNFSIDVGTFSMIYNKSLEKELEEKDKLIEELASRILALENAAINQ